MNLSVVIPVYNEEAGLGALFARLYPALDALGMTYEVIFVNDGSRDRSAALLREQFARRPDVTRVVLLNGNFGQHMAIMAGFERVRGERIVTLDADLQNPPEEIAKLLAKMDQGCDYVGGVRSERHDNAYRRFGSRVCYYTFVLKKRFPEIGVRNLEVENSLTKDRRKCSTIYVADTFARDLLRVVNSSRGRAINLFTRLSWCHDHLTIERCWRESFEDSKALVRTHSHRSVENRLRSQFQMRS